MQTSSTLLNELREAVEAHDQLRDLTTAAATKVTDLLAALSQATLPTPEEELEQIIQSVLLRHRVQRQDLFQRRGLERFSAARHEIWYQLRQRNWTLEEIGRAFKKDHGAVSNGIRRHQQRLEVGETR